MLIVTCEVNCGTAKELHIVIKRKEVKATRFPDKHAVVQVLIG